MFVKGSLCLPILERGINLQGNDTVEVVIAVLGIEQDFKVTREPRGEDDARRTFINVYRIDHNAVVNDVNGISWMHGLEGQIAVFEVYGRNRDGTFSMTRDCWLWLIVTDPQIDWCRERKHSS